MSQIKHKHALYEILEAKMDSGEALDGHCDEILKTSVSKMKSSSDKFIVLGDFIVEPVASGRIKDKYYVVVQDILCSGISRERKEDGEVAAEYWAWTLAKLVRTILKNNQTLISTSYPTGVARKSFVNEAPQEFVLFYDSPTCVHTLSLEIHLEEDVG